MIESIGQVMLYVENVELAASFWKEKMGFERVEKQEGAPGNSYLLAPKKDSEVQFVLHDKAVVAAQNPEMNLGTPSILMVSKDLQATYDQLISRGVEANPIMDLGFMKVFNFMDNEGNYFAIKEI